MAFQSGQNAAHPRGQHRMLSHHIPAAMSMIIVAAHELVNLLDHNLVRQSQPTLDHITLRHPPFRSQSLSHRWRFRLTMNPDAACATIRTQ
ncbi:MAG: hypothetical protein ACRDSP_06415 [Pseudonocardiaceae bacterium]